MSIELKIMQLIGQAEDLPDGDSKVALLDQAIKLAASHQLRQLEYSAKKSYADAAIKAGRAEQMLVHFPWILAYAMENPAEADPGVVLWLYAWAIFMVIDHPKVEKKQILAAIEDWSEKMLQTEIPTYIIPGQRIEFQVHLGNTEEAERAVQEFYTLFARIKQKKKLYWEQYLVAYFREKIGRLDEAKTILDPCLVQEIDDEYCRLAKSMMLIPLLRLGETELAEVQFQFCQKTFPNHSLEIAGIGSMIAYQALVGSWENAVLLFEKSFPTASTGLLGLNYCVYIRGTIHLLKRIPKDLETLSLRLPANHPTYREDGKYAINDLLTYFSDQRTAILSAIDFRNENTFQIDYHTRWDGWAEEIMPPLR